MPAKIIDGKKLALKIQGNLSTEVKALYAKHRITPSLAVILVGQDDASKIYVRNKRLACESIGIKSLAFDLPEETFQATLIELIMKLNQDDSVHGILVQLPLPKHIDETTIIETILPQKDVDGFHPYTIGRLSQRIPTLRPCTPLGVMSILKEHNVNLLGIKAVVVGASNHVGRPLALELLLAGATITICHKFTKNLEEHVAQADLLCVAVGKPNLIPGKWIKPGAIVIDVGISRMPDGSLQGDIEFEAAAKRASMITPVPGGIGPMTVAMLMYNTLEVAKTMVNK
jgi:methylenetetrahydrofolate dehydrogenase (NADP+) / methenyltetrahydrofolate cyclohydrolase